MSGQIGDLATGDGHLGEIVDLPSGMVGLALFNEHGRERRVVYVAADVVKVVKLEQDRPHSGVLRDREFGSMADEYQRAFKQNLQGFGW